MIEIKIEGDVVNFYKDDWESPIYFFEKFRLPHITSYGDDNDSEWITHLLFKTWMETSALYDLAVLIQKEFPDNDIDWGSTFFPVEKREYLNHVNNTMDIISEAKGEQIPHRNSRERFKNTVEENNEIVNGEIHKIVDINLRKHGLK